MKLALEFNVAEEREIDELMRELERVHPTLMRRGYMPTETVLHTATMEGVRKRTESLRKLDEMKEEA